MLKYHDGNKSYTLMGWNERDKNNIFIDEDLSYSKKTIELPELIYMCVNNCCPFQIFYWNVEINHYNKILNKSHIINQNRLLIPIGNIYNINILSNFFSNIISFSVSQISNSFLKKYYGKNKGEIFFCDLPVNMQATLCKCKLPIIHIDVNSKEEILTLKEIL